MINVDLYTPQVKRLLKAEGLDDLDRLVATESWEDYPMFSRYHRIAFLDHLDLLDRSYVLFAHALRHFDRLVEAACAILTPSERARFFLAVSVDSWDGAVGDDPHPPVPSFFVCRDYQSMNKLRRGIHTPQGQIVSDWLTALGVADQWEIAETSHPEELESFGVSVVRRTPLCPGMPTFDQVCDAELNSK